MSALIAGGGHPSAQAVEQRIDAACAPSRPASFRPVRLVPRNRRLVQRLEATKSPGRSTRMLTRRRSAGRIGQRGGFRLPHVSRRHTQHRSQCRAILSGRSLRSGRRPLCLGLPRHHRQPVGRLRAASVALLAHHRRRPAASRRCAAPAWSASSRNSIPATATSTRRAARSRRRRASWSATTRCATSAARPSTSTIPAFSLDMPDRDATVN